VFLVVVVVCFQVVLFDQGLEGVLVASSDVLESPIVPLGIFPPSCGLTSVEKGLTY